MGRVASNLKKAFDLIESRAKESDFSGEKPDSLISLAEKEIGFSFPKSYRAFVKKYGCGDIEGLEIYGLINERFEHGIPDAVGYTLMERKDFNLDHRYLIISNSGDGWVYALDSKSVREDGEYKVVGIYVTKEIEDMAGSFDEFLLSELNICLNY